MRQQSSKPEREGQGQGEPMGAPTAAHVVCEMHRHFRETGAFRASDLDRVLGDTTNVQSAATVGECAYGAIGHFNNAKWGKV